MAWRSWDRPMVGTIFKLPDQTYLQRGVTFTILPDGRPLRVPAMHRQTVRSQSESHREDEGHDLVQALENILKGKAPVEGKARFNKHGVAHGARRQLGRAPIRGGPAPFGDQGLRPVMEGGQQVAEV